MKTMKKFAAMALALMLVLAMSVPAFATEAGTESSDTGSITITNATVGETYHVYKLLDLSYSSDGTSYSYILDSESEWYDFFTSGEGSKYVSVDATTGHVTWTAGDTGTSSLTAALASAALAYANENEIEPTATMTASSEDENATTTELTFSGLEFGYYLIDSSLGSVCTLDSTDPDVEVEDKNPSPSVDKTVMEDTTGIYGDSNTADVGEVVQFRIEITDASGSSNLVLHDTMSSGLTLNTDSFTVKVGSSLASADSTVSKDYYTITTSDLEDGCTFEIAFNDEFTSSILTSSQVIIVTYTATVNADAVITGDGNTNETYLDYGDNTSSTSDKTTTYVYELYVYKYTTTTSSDNTTTEVALSGAKFVLYKEISGTKYYAVLDENGMVSSWTTDSGEATELTTDSTGLVYFGGLDAGTYYLEEMEAPDGYNPLAAAVTVVITQDGTISGSGTVTVSSTDTDENGAETTTETTYTAIKIYNGSSDEMPSTGGIGTTIFYVIGGILVAGACVILITRRRMGRAE